VGFFYTLVGPEMQMSEDVIREIGIDGEGRLYVLPSQQRFPHIYREAMEVSWHESSGTLSAPAPREWSHARCRTSAYLPSIFVRPSIW